jgi:hypothetical protein
MQPHNPCVWHGWVVLPTHPRSFRVGAKPARIFVTMVRDFAPEYHRVTGALAAALSLSSGTRGQILRRLRQHAIAHSTPNPANPSIISPDSSLKTLLGPAPLDVASLNQIIDPYLAPLEPVSLEYTIQLDGPSPSAPLCHDLDVAWSLRPAMLKLPAFMERLDVRQAIEAQDRKATGVFSVALVLCHTVLLCVLLLQGRRGRLSPAGIAHCPPRPRFLEVPRTNASALIFTSRNQVWWVRIPARA